GGTRALMTPGPPDCLRSPPVFVENRPQRLVEILAVAQERLPQDPFLDRADLPQRAVAATVRDRSTRLEAVRSHDIEREVDDHLRAVDEGARAPERGAH